MLANWQQVRLATSELGLLWGCLSWQVVPTVSGLEIHSQAWLDLCVSVLHIYMYTSKYEYGPCQDTLFILPRRELKTLTFYAFV